MRSMPLGVAKGTEGAAELVRVGALHLSYIRIRARGLCQWQFDLEAAALAFAAFHMDLAAVGRANGFNDGQPQPGPACVA